MTVRALLFAVTTNPLLLIGIQLLDGISGSVLGVLTALIVADLTDGEAAARLIDAFQQAIRRRLRKRIGVGDNTQVRMFSTHPPTSGTVA